MSSPLNPNHLDLDFCFSRSGAGCPEALRLTKPLQRTCTQECNVLLSKKRDPIRFLLSNTLVLTLKCWIEFKLLKESFSVLDFQDSKGNAS